MIDNNKEYILCAAYKRIKPKNGHPYKGNYNDICKVELGYRHHDILMRNPPKYNWVYKLLYKLKLYDMAIWWNIHFRIIDETTAGFYTSNGRWVNRYDGMKVAYECGQVSKEQAFAGDLQDWEKKMFDINSDDKDYWRRISEYNPLCSEDLYVCKGDYR